MFVMARYTQTENSGSRTPLLRRLMDNSSGAAIALMGLLLHGRTFGEPIGEEMERCLTTLDILCIRGDDLCAFWFDVCHHNADEVFSLLRACRDEYDGVSRDAIWQAITCARQGRAVPFGGSQLVLETPGL